jgi:stress response protein SCP2
MALWFVDDEMMRGLLNDVMVGLGWDFVSRTGKESSSFGSNPAKNPPNQHDQDVADDPLTTLDYHCLDVSRDNEVSEQAFEWFYFYGSYWVGFWLQNWQRYTPFFGQIQPQLQTSMTKMLQMTLSQP